MILVFACIILTALTVNGVDIATGENMLLEPFKKWVKEKLTNRCKGKNPYKIYKPLIGCVKCMPSIYGTVICLLILPFGVDLIWQIPIVILSSSTVATIINQNYI